MATYFRQLEFNIEIENGVISCDEKTNVTEEINIDQKTKLQEFTLIENLTFLKKVKIQNTDIRSGIIFKDCIFEKGVFFSNVKALNFDSITNKDGYHLHFLECTLSELIFTNSCEFARQIKFESCPEIKQLIIKDLKINNGGINFIKSSIDYFDIIRLTSELSISDSTINKSLRIDSLKGNISLISSKFHDFVTMWNLTCPNSLTLNKNTFYNTFKVHGAQLKGFFIHEDTFEKKVEFENRDLNKGTNIDTFCDEIYITAANFVEGADFNGLSKSIHKITINLTPRLKGLVNFEGWDVKGFQLMGVNESLKLLFKRMVFESAFIMNFTNYGDISFNKCEAKNSSVLHLTNCDFGATRFGEFNFNSFKEITFDNVAIDNIKTYNVKWFDDETLIDTKEADEKSKSFSRRRDFYRQLKHALIKNGNKIESLIFQARELNAFQKELGKPSLANWQNQFILWFSKSNNFGLSWWKPTWITLLITLVFYILILPIISSNLEFSLAKSTFDVQYTINEFFNQFHTYWQLLNPTRKIDAIFGETQNGWLYFFDLLQRVVLGALLFQIIRGFRKFTLK